MTAQAPMNSTAPLTSEKTAKIFFMQGENVFVDGSIHRGKPLIIDYSPYRFQNRPTNLNLGFVGATAWGVKAFVKFSPESTVITASILDPAIHLFPQFAQLQIKTVELMVPQNASSVEMWFQRYDVFGTVEWDSRFGENYRFNIV